MKAGRVYLGVLLTTSITLLLLGVCWVYAIAGTTEFTPGGILAGKDLTAAARSLCWRVCSPSEPARRR